MHEALWWEIENVAVRLTSTCGARTPSVTVWCYQSASVLSTCPFPSCRTELSAESDGGFTEFFHASEGRQQARHKLSLQLETRKRPRETACPEASFSCPSGRKARASFPGVGSAQIPGASHSNEAAVSNWPRQFDESIANPPPGFPLWFIQEFVANSAGVSFLGSFSYMAWRSQTSYISAIVRPYVYAYAEQQKWNLFTSSHPLPLGTGAVAASPTGSQCSMVMGLK